MTDFIAAYRDYLTEEKHASPIPSAPIYVI